MKEVDVLHMVECEAEGGITELQTSLSLKQKQCPALEWEQWDMGELL